jgi:hypothetical protein
MSTKHVFNVKTTNRVCCRSSGWPSNHWLTEFGPVDQTFGLTASFCGRYFHSGKCLIKVRLLLLILNPFPVKLLFPSFV